MPSRSLVRPEGRGAAERKQAQAFVTARKGFCYLTTRFLGRNRELMHVRAYEIDPVEKRDMRRLYPEVAFNWREITEQPAEKREVCRHYRTRPRRRAGWGSAWEDKGLFGVYKPARTILTNGIPSTAAGVGRLLDAVFRLDRELMQAPSQPEPARMPAELGSEAAVRDGKPAKLR